MSSGVAWANWDTVPAVGLKVRIRVFWIRCIGISLLFFQVPIIVNILWDILLDLDDLDSSTKSVMSLLSSLISKKTSKDCLMESIGNMTELFPRLWPFLKHNISAVRISALESLNTLLKQVPDAAPGQVCVFPTPQRILPRPNLTLFPVYII